MDIALVCGAISEDIKIEDKECLVDLISILIEMDIDITEKKHVLITIY